MRTVNLLEIGSAENTLITPILDQAFIIGHSIAQAFSDFINVEDLHVDFKKKRRGESTETIQSQWFECSGYKFLLEMHNADLDLLTKLHLSDKAKLVDTTYSESQDISLTHSHFSVLNKVGLVFSKHILNEDARVAVQSYKASHIQLVINIKANNQVISVQFTFAKETVDFKFNEWANKLGTNQQHMNPRLIEAIPIPLSAELGTTSIPINQVQSLEVGSFIPLKSKKDISLKTEGIAIGAGELTLQDGHMVLTLK
ncbi:FliM/FliN family flagellar motor switch protein [Vibrio sp. PNB22_3_1]